MSTEGRNPLEMTQFGVFYPRGYIVAAFGSREDAERVRRDLMAGGYDEQDCVLVTSEEAKKGASESLSNSGFLATLGKSDEAVRRHLEAAEKGATLLLVYAPGDLEAERAMNVVHRVPFKFAHRYHRLAIQELE